MTDLEFGFGLIAAKQQLPIVLLKISNKNTPITFSM